MKIKHFPFILVFFFSSLVTAQSASVYTVFRLPEYNLLFVQSHLSRVSENATDEEVDAFLEAALQDMISALSDADKSALGFTTEADRTKLEKMLLKNFDLMEFETHEVAKKERTRYTNVYQDLGYTVYTFPAKTIALQNISHTSALNDFPLYSTNTVAKLKESGKKNFLAQLSFLQLKVNYADWREDKLSDYKKRGLQEMTGQLPFALKDHDYYGKTDDKTGVQMIYELGYLPKANGRGRVYEESFMLGMRPQTAASGTPEEQMRELMGTYENLKKLIIKEAGQNTDSLIGADAPYSEENLKHAVEFMNALAAGRLRYATYWSSVGKTSEFKPSITLELHPSKMVKVKVFQNEPAE